MKKTKSFWITMLALSSLLVISACGDDDSEPNNQIAVNGKSYKFNKAHMQTEFINDEVDVYYEHAVIITGKGLAADEDGNFEGIGPLCAIVFLTESETLEEGEYRMGISTELPHAVEFVLIPSLNTDEGFEKIHYGYGGTINVSKSGDTYSFKIDFNVYSTETEEADEEFGKGKIKGNYRGEITLVEESEPGRRSQFDFLKSKGL